MSAGAGLEDLIRQIVREELAAIQTSSPAPAPAPTLTPAQAAVLLGIPESTVRERVRRGTLPKVSKADGAHPQSAVEALLK
jgi:excisionase family DNA binding protein